MNYPRGIENVVATFILNKNNEVLLIKSPKFQDIWTFAGGHVEPGETIKEASIREAKEETNLDCEQYSDFFFFKDIINLPEFKRKAHMHSFAIALICNNIEDLKIDPKEIIDNKWIKLKEALNENLLSVNKEIIKSYLEFSK